MKKLCKHTDITDWQTILPWVIECITSNKHWKRHDFRKLLLRHGLAADDYYAVYQTHDYGPWQDAMESIAKEAAQAIYEGDLNLPPIKIRPRYDAHSGKLREIGCESAMQQIYDFIAVNAAMPIFERRMVPQQASSVKERGQIYGMRLIRRWAMKNRAGIEYAKRHGYRPRNRMRYFVKLDIQKCFPSCRWERFMGKFGRDCGNKDLIWLWRTLLQSHQIDKYHQGFIIGALTSQWAAQYIISFAYHHVMELHKPLRRGGKDTQRVTHMLIFMDDMVLCGPSRNALKQAVVSLSRYMLDEFGLTINPHWSIQEFTDANGIDMMGYVIHPSGKVEIRARDWVKVRRMLLRSINLDYRVSYKQAKRLTAYKGYIKHSNSVKARTTYHTLPLFREAQRVVSTSEKNARAKNADIVCERKTLPVGVYAPA